MTFEELAKVRFIGSDQIKIGRIFSRPVETYDPVFSSRVRSQSMNICSIGLS